MARPQLENGHTKIANELEEAFARVNLSAYESRMVRCIERKTYGWNKKMDRISYSQFQEATQLDRRHIARTLKQLISRGIITCQGDGQQLEYGIQKDYERWQDRGKPLPKEATEGIDSTIASTGNGIIVTNHCLSRSQPLPVEGKPLPKEATKPLPKEATTKAIKHLQKHITKERYGEFNNVLLSVEEYKKLVDQFGENVVKEKIETLAVGIESKGYKYKSHYATILSWDRLDKKRKGVMPGEAHQDIFAAARGDKPYTKPPPFRE